MKDEDIRFNRMLAVLIMASFTFFATMVALRLGLGQTGYGTVDSAGRPMGFNDLLGAEHYTIMLRNFRFADLFRPERAYEWFLLAMHVAGACLLICGRRVSGRSTRWFFAIQPLLFPFGIPAILILPFIITGMLTGGTDREGFVDIPFIVCTAHPLWVITSLFITLALRGPGLGLSRVRDTVVHATRAGVRRVSVAIR